MFGNSKQSSFFGGEESSSSSMFGSSENKSMFGGSKKSMFSSEKPSAVQAVVNKIPGFEEEPCCAAYCPKLTYEQRIYGYAGCAVFGFILSIVGTLILLGGPSASNIRLFIIFYVLGSVVALCSTGFLLGPRSQCAKMWAPTRRWSTAFYLLMLIVVFIVAILKQNIILILFLLVIEILAATWYSISYIPFGRKITLAFLRRTGVCMPCFYVYDEGKKIYDEAMPKKDTTLQTVTGTGKGSQSSGSKGGGMFSNKV